MKRQKTKSKKDQIPVNTGDLLGKDKKPGTFEPGDPRINRDGRPVGSRNFETAFLETVDEIAKLNHMTRDEALAILYKKAYAEAKDGKFAFWDSIMDRLHGKAKLPIEHSVDKQTLQDIEGYMRAIAESIPKKK